MKESENASKRGLLGIDDVNIPVFLDDYDFYDDPAI